MKSLLPIIFISSVFLWQTSLSQTPQLKIEVTKDTLKINNSILTMPISVSTINELVGEKGVVISHKQKKFRDKQHGETHIIPKYIEVIYNNSGLVFTGREIENLTRLKVHFLNKQENQLLIDSILNAEYEGDKGQPYFNLSKKQHMETFSSIDIGNLGPLPSKSYSGELMFNYSRAKPDASLISLDKIIYEDKIKSSMGLYNPYSFTASFLSQEFECLVPSLPGVVRGFCECVAPGVQFILIEKNMKLHSMVLYFGELENSSNN